MLRQRDHVELRFDGDADQRLVDSGSRLHPGTLKVRVHGHRITARWPPTGNFDSPPVFRGRVDRQVDKFSVNGTTRETASLALIPVAFALVAAVGVALLVIGITSHDSASDNGTIPLVLGCVLTPLFALLLVVALRVRRRRFRRQASRLQTGLANYLRTGNAADPRS